MDYPKMLYMLGGDVALQDGNYATLIVNNEQEETQAKVDGWAASPVEAKAVSTANAPGWKKSK